MKFGKKFGSGSQTVCPYLFKNAARLALKLHYQVDSFLFVTLFRFQKVNYTNASINSNVGTLELHGFGFKLDTDLLHPLVFENLNSLLCSGTIDSIQPDLFKMFGVRLTMVFQLHSLGQFYHQIGIEWMTFLAIGSRLAFSSHNIPYVYPGRDFCIFSKFPQNRSLWLAIDIPKESTLTYFWLCKYARLGGGQCSNWTVYSFELDQKFKLCQLKANDSEQLSQSNAYPSYSDYYQTRLIEILLVELVPFVLIPCACLVGFFLNWKIIKTITNNKKKDLKEDFYKYMSANAKFNCIYCLIFVFYPITSCTWNLSYYFCSSIFHRSVRSVLQDYHGSVFWGSSKNVRQHLLSHDDFKRVSVGREGPRALACHNSKARIQVRGSSVSFAKHSDQHWPRMGVSSCKRLGNNGLN
jgi:hypothetical protein